VLNEYTARAATTAIALQARSQSFMMSARDVNEDVVHRSVQEQFR